MVNVFHAAWVFPVSSPPIRHGFVAVDQGRVIEVSDRLLTSAKVIDLGQVALLPRPINAHTHLEFSDLAKPLGAPGQSFAAWITEVLAQRATRAAPKAQSIEAGLSELRQSLTAGVGEIATLPSAVSDYGDSPLAGVAFHEIISTDYERGLARLAEIAALGENWPRELGLRFGLSPHAPYTVEWRLLQRIIETSSAKRWPVAMHLGESLEEFELLASHSGKLHQLLVDRGVWNPAAAPRGIRLADYLAQLAKAPRALAIHGNFFGNEEHEILARHRDRMSLVICPRTCDYFLPRLPPIAELLVKGIHIAIGTDSRATNPDLSIWNEAKFLLEKAPNLAPAEILRLVTLSSAKSLGLAQHCGQIVAGIPMANLALVDLPQIEMDDNAAISAAIAQNLYPVAEK
jgi:aminodeoxyfutalosine deaminase